MKEWVYDDEAMKTLTILQILRQKNFTTRALCRGHYEGVPPRKLKVL